ncbi:MAG: hypothetical protein ACRDTF_11945 [Pseudonocardiaceae bacterium]
MSATGVAIALGLLLTTQHALAAAPIEIDDASTLRISQTSAGGGALTSISGVISRTELAAIDRIGVTDDSFSTVLGISLDTRLSLFEHYGAGRASGGTLRYPLGVGPWTDWDDSNTATDSYTITLTNHLAAGHGDGEDG